LAFLFVLVFSENKLLYSYFLIPFSQFVLLIFYLCRKQVEL